MKKILSAGIILLSLILAAPVLSVAAQDAQAAQAAAVSSTIDLNAATVKELQSLPGVGKVTARRIVDYRANYPFKSVDDLLKVKGIGKKKLAKIRDLVRVE